MIQNPDNHHLVLQKIESCLQLATTTFNQSFAMPEVSYRLRGRAAGKAYMQQWKIELNLILFAENQQIFFEQVIPHEVAHLITFQLFGRQAKPHGREWKSIMMTVFNLMPTVTHRLELTSVQGKMFDYHCACQSHTLTIRRHNKIVRQQARYYCQRCNTPLMFKHGA